MFNSLFYVTRCVLKGMQIIAMTNDQKLTEAQKERPFCLICLCLGLYLTGDIL